MALVSTSATKTATVPFDLLALSYAVRRDFLDVMPLKDLYALRKGSDIVKSLSSFRGEIVDVLVVETDTSKEYYGACNRFSEIINRRFNTTPLKVLKVIMGTDICPDVLLSKMDGQYYTDLINLPAENMEEFFNILICYKVKRIFLHTANYKPTWLFTAEKICNNAGLTTKYVSYEERYCPEIVVTIGNEKIRIFGYSFLGKRPYFDDSDVEESDE